VNYDLWTGPAPLVPPHRNNPKNGPIHYDWHWVYLYGNGDVGNQGIHPDGRRALVPRRVGLPRHTISIGGRLGYVDDGDTPNTQVVVHDYADAPLIFEVRGLPKKAGIASAGGDPAAQPGRRGGDMDKYRGVDIGNVIDCEGGSLITTQYFCAKAVDKSGKTVKEFKGDDRHMQNFIDVIRNRKTDELYGPIEEGNTSSALCHLGNISHQIGARPVPRRSRRASSPTRSSPRRTAGWSSTCTTTTSISTRRRSRWVSPSSSTRRTSASSVQMRRVRTRCCPPSTARRSRCRRSPDLPRVARQGARVRTTVTRMETHSPSSCAWRIEPSRLAEVRQG
jgi:hypothetical protein